MSDNAETREALEPGVLLYRGPFSGIVWAATRWHERDGRTVVDEKHDVTDQFTVLAALPPVAGPEVRPDETMRALSEAATPGEWRAVDDPGMQVGYGRGGEFDETPMARVVPGYGGTCWPWDAAFIAAAVNHVRDWLAAPAPAPGDEGLRAIVREHIACCLEDPAGRDVDVETDDLMDALASPAPAATEVGEGE